MKCRSNRLPLPCILTGENLRPDMRLAKADKCFYIVDVTVGIEINLDNNAQRKEIKYHPLLKHFSYP